MRLSAALLTLLAAPAFAAVDPLFDAGSALPAVASAVPQAGRGQAEEIDPRLWIVVQGGRSVRNAVSDAGVSIEAILPDRVGGIGTPDMAEALRRQGLRVATSPLRQQFRAEGFPEADAAFHDYDEMGAELSRLAVSAPGLASLFSIGRSHNGRDLWCLRLNTTASGAEPSAKPGVAFLGTHHAREHLSTEVPLRVARWLLENRGRADVAALLASRDVYFVPMVNPDGVEHDISGGRYHMHRKNMRRNDDGTTGVDLNRNYSYGWGGGGSSSNPNSDIYRGEAAFSEPETQAVRDFVTARKDSLKVLLSYHTFSELILYPWGHSDDPIPEERPLAAYKKMAREMAGMTGYTPQQSSELYIASGDTTDWSWGTHKIYSFTFELTPKSMWDGGFYPGASAIATTVQANIRPALYLLNLADDPLKVLDEAGVAAGR